jgi:hypothetical protein
MYYIFRDFPSWSRKIYSAFCRPPYFSIKPIDFTPIMGSTHHDEYEAWLADAAMTKKRMN